MKLIRTGALLTRVIAPAAAVTVTLVMSTSGAMAQPGGAADWASPGQWPMAGQNIDDTHFQAAEHQISPANVGRLAPRWTLTTAGAISATPTVDDSAVYVPDYGGKLWAVAAGSGRVLWSRDISSYTGVAGDQSRTSPAVYGNELILGDGWILSPSTSGTRVFAVDRRTGAPVWSTVVDTDPAAIITGSPVVFDGVAYFGISSKGEGTTADSFRGAVIALDAATGRLLWKAYMVPSNNGGSDSNKPGYYSGVAVWESSFAVDPQRGLLYVDTGNNYGVPAGVCTTWTLLQPIGPDFDFGAGPNLFTTTSSVTGRPEQLLGVGQKSGVYWAVDPATGKVVWQTQVGPVGILYGTATDGRRIYAADGDFFSTPYTLGGSGPNAGQTIIGGSWTALDPATGKILWQTPDPQGAIDASFVSAANGVIYAGSLAATGTDMYALDAATGTILWSFASGGSVTGGAAIADGTVYWGSGYCGTACLGSAPVTNNNKVYAFGLRR